MTDTVDWFKKGNNEMIRRSKDFDFNNADDIQYFRGVCIGAFSAIMYDLPIEYRQKEGLQAIEHIARLTQVMVKPCACCGGDIDGSDHKGTVQ